MLIHIMHGHCGSDWAFIPKEMEKEGHERVCGLASPESGEERVLRRPERTAWFNNWESAGESFSSALCVAGCLRQEVCASI